MNKQRILAAFAAMAVLLLAGCTQTGTSAEFEVKNFKAEDSTVYALTEVELDYPVAGPQVLVDSVRAWMNEMLGSSYTGDMEDGQALVNFYQQRADAQVKDTWDEIRADMGVDESDDEEGSFFDIPGEDHTSMTLAWQNEHFLTYDFTFFEYSSGAAHGIEGCFGTTFLKEDGSRMTWADIVEKESDGFQTILREGLKSYFGLETDEELSEELFLMDDHTVYNIPLPGREPCMRAEGVEFYYGEYEIASYSSGTPSFIVPVSKMRPYLSKRVLKLFDEATLSDKKEDFSHRTEMF